MNQSATATLWPFTVVWTRLGDRPRRETRSPSPNSRLMTTPGTRCTASARFLSGSLLTSFAAMASTMASDSRLTLTASRNDSAVPRTVISSVTGSTWSGWGGGGAWSVGGWGASVPAGATPGTATLQSAITGLGTVRAFDTSLNGLVRPAPGIGAIKGRK